MITTIGRRGLLVGSGGIVVAGCQPSPPKTPLAHLYGERWVHGAYELYAQGYQKVEHQSEDQSFAAYRTLAQRGVTALDGLQQREVPFFIRVTDDERSFKVERQVPERLTFTAGMSDADRAEATAAWEKAREFIHTDYEEVRRLDDALSTLLAQQQRVRFAIDSGHEEQFKLVRQLRTLEQGEAPFALPYQVTKPDYQQILALLLDRLDTDAASLGRVESAIVATGLVVRATDANSGSLAANLRQVLLAVDEDAAAVDRSPVVFPSGDERARRLDHGLSLATSIEATPEYKLWLRREQTKNFDAIGTLLVTLDSVTHLPLSSIYRQVLEVWRNDGDYLEYLKIAISLVPGGSKLAAILRRGVELTDKARVAIRQGQELLEDAREAQRRGETLIEHAEQKGKELVDRAQKQGQAMVDKAQKQGRAMVDRARATERAVEQALDDGTARDAVAAQATELLKRQGAGLLNTASRYAERRLERQLSFFTSRPELKQVTERLQASRLLQLPGLPALPGLR